MSQPTELQAMERDETLNPRQLRAAGFVPATVYGASTEPVDAQVKHKEFAHKFLHGARVFKLDGLLSSPLAKAKNLQVDPVSQNVLSVEFLVMTEADAKAYFEGKQAVSV